MKRFQAHLCFIAGLATVTAFYACGSSSNGNSGGPPQTEAGPDQTSSSSGSSSGGSEASTDGNEDAGPLECGELPGTIVYVLADDTQESLLKVLGRQLRDDADITLVFQLVPSCTLTATLLAGTPIAGNTSLFYIPSTKEDPSWKPSDPESTCPGSPVHGPLPNLGISALSPTSCPGLGFPPAGIGVLTGPTQAYTFVVPTAEFTSQKSISAAEAYYAFGDGANNPVTYNGAPEWNDPTQFFLRPATASSLVASALDTGLTPAEMTFAAADAGPADGRHLLAGSAAVVTAVKGATSMQAIGLLEDAAFDANRNQGVDALAFAALGQTYAFYPDSTATSLDKQNVRDGHYAIWGPEHFFARVNGGVPSDAAGAFVSRFTTPKLDQTLLDAIIKSGLVPACAMDVTRDTEMGAIKPFSPEFHCGCYFEATVPGGSPGPGCAVCKGPADCPSSRPACNNGFCEVR